MRIKVLIAIGLIITGGYFKPLFLSADDPKVDGASGREVALPVFLIELVDNLRSVLGTRLINGGKTPSFEIELLRSVLDTSSSDESTSGKRDGGARTFIINRLYQDVLGRPEPREKLKDQFYQNMINNRSDRVSGAPSPYRRDMFVNQMYSDILRRDTPGARTQFVVVQTVLGNSNLSDGRKIRVRDIVQLRSSSGVSSRDIDFSNRTSREGRQDLFDAIQDNNLSGTTIREAAPFISAGDDKRRNTDVRERRRLPPRTGVRPLGPRPPPIRPPLMGTR